MVPDESAGQNYTCSTCGRTVVVPSESSDDCVLVFKDGFPNEGIPYDKEDFLAKLSERFFTGHDLIFVNGAWIPICVVYESPAKPEPPPPIGDEIATTFAELPPIPGVYAETMKNSPKRKANRVKFLLAYVLPAALVLLLVAYFTLFKPLMNRMKWRCSYVMVFNPDAKDYTVSLSGQTQNLSANSSCVFQDVFPWFSGNKNLVIAEQGGAVAYSMKVPLLPDYDVIVSPGGKLKFDTFDYNSANAIANESVKADSVVKELSANLPPASLYSIGSELYDIGIKQHVNSLDNQIFSSAQYSFTHIGLVRSAKYIEKRKDANLDRRGKPELVHGPLKFSVSNGSFDFAVNEKSSPFIVKLPKGVKLPSAQVCEAVRKFQTDNGTGEEAVISVHPSSKAEQISVSYPEKGSKLQAAMEFRGDLASKQHKYSGTWKCTVVAYLSGADSGKWQWEWRFNGKLVPKYSSAPQPPIEIVYSRALDGSETVTIKNGAR